ncbi:MAG: GAF domain-containing protein, partial [Lentilitoribacter sp.]
PAARDGKSYKLRASTDQKYSERDRSYRYNSVFVEILDKQLTHRIFNDIDVAELNGEYSNNANEHRRDSYNSCLVVPISQKKQGLNKNDVLGFICIDSKEAQFEDDYFLQLNFVISTMISIYMENILAKLYAQELNIFENENTRKKESEPL